MLLAPAAHAATVDLTDDSGDVMTATLQQNGDIRYNREHGEEGDIVFARVQHTATQLVVYMRYLKLSVPTQDAGFEYRLEGNNGSHAYIDLETRHAKPQGTVSIASERRRCRTAHKVNYAADSVSARIPRRCLNKAKYVRVAHVSYRARETDSSFKVYYDDAMRNGGNLGQVDNNPTPWVVTD